MSITSVNDTVNSLHAVTSVEETSAASSNSVEGSTTEETVIVDSKAEKSGVWELNSSDVVKDLPLIGPAVCEVVHSPSLPVAAKSTT